LSRDVESATDDTDKLIWIARGCENILEESSVTPDQNERRARPANDRKGRWSQCEGPAIRDTLNVYYLRIGDFPQRNIPKEPEGDRCRLGVAVIDIVAE
jgi:hypothetical protein